MMEDRNTTRMMNQAEGPKDEPDRLLETYGHHLTDSDLDEAQRKELLMSLWQIMRSFAELGFSVKSGDKLYSDADHGFDDVLNYIISEETAPETVASPTTNKDQEQS